MSKARVFLAYPFKFPDIEDAVRSSIVEFADVIVAKDEVDGSHILDKIVRQMNESRLCLFDLTGINVNVVLELGIAIGKSTSYCLLRRVTEADDSADFFSDLKGWDHIRYADIDDLKRQLREYVPKQLQRTSDPAATTHVVVPLSTYAGEARDILSEAVGQGGLMIPSYICSMSLVVHPSAYVGDKVRQDEERSLIEHAASFVRLGFPYVNPSAGANLNDGIEAISGWQRDAPPPLYREYYRLTHDGLFVLIRISPDDINENQQYPDRDRVIRATTIIKTFTAMTLFASALASSYDEVTTTVIRFSGLLNHRFIDDTADHALGHDGAVPCHEEGTSYEFNGTPVQYQNEALGWSVRSMAQCIRLLNVPATLISIESKVRNLQHRLLASRG